MEVELYGSRAQGCALRCAYACRFSRVITRRRDSGTCVWTNQSIRTCQGSYQKLDTPPYGRGLLLFSVAITKYDTDQSMDIK